jgi:hypothetical protein
MKTLFFALLICISSFAWASDADFVQRLADSVRQPAIPALRPDIGIN